MKHAFKQAVDRASRRRANEGISDTETELEARVRAAREIEDDGYITEHPKFGPLREPGKET